MTGQLARRSGLWRWMPDSVRSWCWLLPAVIGVPLVWQLPVPLAGPEPADWCDWRADEYQRYYDGLGRWAMLAAAVTAVLLAVSVVGSRLTRATSRPATGPRPSGTAVVMLVALQFVLVLIYELVVLWFIPMALLVLGYKSRALRWTGYGLLVLFAAVNLVGHLLGPLCIG